MILKYTCQFDGDNYNYFAVENFFKDALEDYNFIDAVDYDGEYINLIFSETNVSSAQENEIKLANAVQSTIKKLYTTM